MVRRFSLYMGNGSLREIPRGVSGLEGGRGGLTGLGRHFGDEALGVDDVAVEAQVFGAYAEGEA